MTRREIMLAALAIWGTTTASWLTAQDVESDPEGSVPPHPVLPAWTAWKVGHLTDDGRIVDTLQKGASHSESQGYGLFLAATMGDAASFDSIDAWTMTNLAIRQDALLAWRWLPDQDAAVPDTNNASDGDLFYAWALVRAAKSLGRPALIDRARKIVDDLINACIRTHPDGSGRLVFTPAAAGFQRDTGLIINPSYLMPRAMQEIAAATGQDQLQVCAVDGMSIQSDLAALGLMPDWIELRANGPVPAADMSDNNGYDALRVPLFLIWSGHTDHAAVQREARAYEISATGGHETPTIMDRLSGNVLDVSPDAGYRAIATLVSCATTASTGSLIPFFDADQPYYPATLHLMTLLAQIETLPQCVPL